MWQTRVLYIHHFIHKYMFNYLFTCLHLSCEALWLYWFGNCRACLIFTIETTSIIFGICDPRKSYEWHYQNMLEGFKSSAFGSGLNLHGSKNLKT